MIQPREYQIEAMRKVFSMWKAGITRQLISLPTGCGKTIVFGLIAEALKTRTLILAHREELLYQAEQKIHFVYPDADTGILKAGERGGLNSEICIASVQTAIRHLDELKAKDFKLLICDEAHHAVSDSYMQTFAKLGFTEGSNDKLLLGVTATAFRNDKKELADVFQEIVFERSIETMIKAGYLCDIRGLSVSTGTDISCVNMVNGDFEVNKLAALIDIPERNSLIANTYIKHGENRHGVVFCVKVEHAKNVAEAFRTVGITCEAVYGDMPPELRQDVLKRYAEHEIQMLTSVGVLTEGWDVPDTDIVMMARPTKSQGLYIQCVGRGLRIAPNKKDCLLVDFVDNAKKHELCGLGVLSHRPIRKRWQGESFLDELKKEKNEEEKTYKAGVYMSPEETEFMVFNRSEYMWQSRNEHYFLKLLNNVTLWCQAAKGGYSPLECSENNVNQLSDSILPLDYCMGVCEDYARHAGAKYALKNAPWRSHPASEAQKSKMRQLGFVFNNNITKGEASDILARYYNTPSTPNQRRVIRRFNLHPTPDLLSKSEAGRLIFSFRQRQFPRA